MRSITATLLVWVLVVSAQQVPPQLQGTPGAPGATKNTYKFEATSTLVVEDVIVKDKSGQPIEGLTAKDFTVTEDGKPQSILFCEYQKLEEAAQPQTELAPKPAPEPQKKEDDKPVAKPVTANQIAPEKPGDIKYKDRRLMVMFFDMTSMPIQDQFRAQGAAQKFLKTQMTPSDLMAIMTFSSDVKVVEDFTDDRDQLAKDIKNLTIGEGQGLDVTTSDDGTE